ncbi:hypothetical protein BKA66DRAFT_440665 [Pyrenochaeta sp. MPI-SDFR-AT-0127]|nr:hypothetical protein BKA66DRAFT_440665 [Pyrenochaeta sp. MPI-SDFR-AT-0127]
MTSCTGDVDPVSMCWDAPAQAASTMQNDYQTRQRVWLRADVDGGEQRSVCCSTGWVHNQSKQAGTGHDAGKAVQCAENRLWDEQTRAGLDFPALNVLPSAIHDDHAGAVIGCDTPALANHNLSTGRRFPRSPLSCLHCARAHPRWASWRDKGPVACQTSPHSIVQGRAGQLDLGRSRSFTRPPFHHLSPEIEPRPVQPSARAQSKKFIHSISKVCPQFRKIAIS